MTDVTTARISTGANGLPTNPLSPLFIIFSRRPLSTNPAISTTFTVGDIWRELPMDKRLLMQWWQVPRDEIPQDREDQIEWLFGWWERIDLWINEHRAEDLPVRRRGASAG